MRRHLVPVRVGVLPAVRVRREGVPVHIHTTLAHRVLPAPSRDHTAHVAHRAPARQISPLHHGPGHVVRVRHRGRVERKLQVCTYTITLPSDLGQLPECQLPLLLTSISYIQFLHPVRTDAHYSIFFIILRSFGNNIAFDCGRMVRVH